MNEYVIIMVAAAAIGFIFAAVSIINAYKIFISDDFRKLNHSKNVLKNKLPILMACPLSNLIYAVVCSAIIYMEHDGFSISMKIPCYIMGIAAFICSALQGIVLKKDIINGALDDDKMISTAVLKIGIIEIISIAALTYFFIQVNY